MTLRTQYLLRLPNQNGAKPSVAVALHRFFDKLDENECFIKLSMDTKNLQTQ